MIVFLLYISDTVVFKLDIEEVFEFTVKFKFETLVIVLFIVLFKFVKFVVWLFNMVNVVLLCVVNGKYNVDAVTWLIVKMMEE